MTDPARLSSPDSDLLPLQNDKDTSMSLTRPHPGRILCAMCGEGQLPTEFDPELHAWLYQCDGCVGIEGGPYEWWMSEPKAGSGSSDRTGIMADLGMYDAAVEAVARIPDRWLEFGVVEALFAEVAPDAWAELVEIYGHVGLKPDRNTASWMLGRATWAVARDGDLAVKPVAATGRWSYMSGIHAWSLPGAAVSPDVLTWAEFATSRGHDPLKCYYVENL